jgi:hypothetical protein
VPRSLARIRRGLLLKWAQVAPVLLPRERSARTISRSWGHRCPLPVHPPRRRWRPHPPTMRLRFFSPPPLFLRLAPRLPWSNRFSRRKLRSLGYSLRCNSFNQRLPLRLRHSRRRGSNSPLLPCSNQCRPPCPPCSQWVLRSCPSLRTLTSHRV